MTPDIGRRTSDIGQRTSDGEKSKNNISTPQGGGHNNTFLIYNKFHISLDSEKNIYIKYTIHNGIFFQQVPCKIQLLLLLRPFLLTIKNVAY